VTSDKIETVGSKLLKEIERVAGLRARYESLRAMPQVNVEPVINLMTFWIDAARRAIEEEDGMQAMLALHELEGFTE
jgi:hypothetical protein